MKKNKYVINVLAVTALLISLFALSISTPQTVQAQGSVDMVLNLPPTPIGVGDEFDVTVEVQAGTEPVNAAQAYLNFDPSLLQVVSFAGGSALEDSNVPESGPKIDNTAGEFGYAAGLLGSSTTGTFDLVTITFQAVAPTTGTSLEFNATFPRQTKVTLTTNSNNVLGTADSVSIVVEGDNAAPTADAGNDQTVVDADGSGSELVDLDGSGSSDSDGTINSYIWSDENDNQIAIGVSPTVSFDVGVHTVTLTVTDDDGDTDTDTVTITVNEAPNAAPTANAGQDQTVVDNDDNGSEEVTLDGSGSADNDGTIESYVWSENGNQIAIGVSPTVSFDVGVHTVTLTVTDDDGDTDTDTVTITVNEPDNQAPTANAGQDQTVVDNDDNGSEDVTLDGSGSADNDGTINSYVWSENGNQIAIGVSPTVSFDVGTHTVTLTVTDDDGATDTDTVSITVEAAPQDDVFILINPANTTVEVGEIFSVTVEVQAGTQPLNAAQSYIDFDTNLLAVQSLAPGDTFDSVLDNGFDNSAGTIDFSAGTLGDTVSGDFDLVTIVFEALAETTGTPLTFNDTFPRQTKATATGGVSVLSDVTPGTVVIEPANVPPTAEAGQNQTVVDTDGNGSESVNLDGSGSSDSDGTIVSYAWSENGNEIATGVSPTVSFPVGSHQVTLTVTDDDGATGTDTVTIIVDQSDNQAPIADAGQDQTVEDTDGNGSEEVTLDGSGSSDNDGTIVSYAWSEEDSEIATGVSPTVSFDVGIHNVTLTVTDTDGISGTDMVTITVNDVPVADAGPNQTVTDINDNGSETVQLDASGSADSVGGIISYSWSENDSEIATGVSPLVNFDVGTHEVTLTITDDLGAVATDSLTVEVQPFTQQDDVFIVVNPVSTTVEVDEVFDVAIQVVAGAQSVNGAEAHLDFDPTLLEVQSLTPGGALGTTIINSFDNATGEIDYAAGVLGNSPPSGTFDLVTISFKALAPTTGTDLSFVSVFPRRTNATTLGGVEVLSGVVPGEVVITENQPPVADDQQVSVDEDDSVSITLTASDDDNDPLTYEVVDQPTNGSLSGTPPNLTYTPDPDYSGPDSFTFKVNDGNQDSNIATVDITVNEVPEAVILGSVTLQGRPATPDPRWSVPLTVALYEVGATTPAYEFTPTTDNNGEFTLNEEIEPGEYEIAVKNFHTLQNVVQIELVDGDNSIDFGTLLEGDANDDNLINLVDFSIMSTVFNVTENDIEFVPGADFNEDGVISLLDFSLLSSNYNQLGQEVSGSNP